MLSQGKADLANLPVADCITASTCSLAYRIRSRSEPEGSERRICSLKCSALGRHLVIAGSITGSSARHVTLSAQQEHRRRSLSAGSRGDWSQDWQVACPLWVKVKDELARPLLADAARLGLCAPPASLLALDAEALDTILQQLPVRTKPAPA